MHSLVRFCIWKPLLAVLALGAGLLCLGGQAAAQVKPGDFINWQNADKVRDIVSPGYEPDQRSPIIRQADLRGAMVRASHR
jgi:hypothetical protein